MNMQATQQITPDRAVITVQQIMPAPSQGKSARIKSADGMFFGIWPNQLGGVAIGESYEIDFVSKVSNGTTFRDIKAIRTAQRPSPAPDQFTAGRPQPRSLSSGASPVTQAQQNNNGQSYRPTAPKDARRMWLCSQLNAMIESRQVILTTDSLIEANRMLMDVYDATIGLDDQ